MAMSYRPSLRDELGMAWEGLRCSQDTVRSLTQRLLGGENTSAQLQRWIPKLMWYERRVPALQDMLRRS